MKKVGIVYFSQTQVTAQLAESVARGVQRDSRIELVEHRILGEEIINGRFVNDALLAELTECDAIISGTPMYMGGVSAQFKAFCDSTSELWAQQRWSGKFAAGFTCGAGFNGDQGSTLHYLATFASQHGMLWMGIDTHGMHNDGGVNRLGCQMGVTAQSFGNVHPDDSASAHYLGERMANIITGEARSQ